MTPRLLAAALLAATLSVVLSGCAGCSEPPAQAKLKDLGVPCEEDDECELSFCEATPGGPPDKVCMRPCAEGCLIGSEICTSVSKERFACVPEKAGLCQACVTKEDCPYPADECVKLGDESFCARDCRFDGICPDSFRCSDARLVDGGLVTRQCQPRSSTCGCTAESAGQTLPCENTNTLGTCTGKVTCDPNQGYSTCDARVPANETCNNVDDDCDGQTDEGLGDLECGVGLCRRTASACINGAPGACYPGVGEVEQCNGLDDDCDGAVDDGYNLQTSLDHCGACNNRCAPPNALPQCAGGECLVAACFQNFYNLNGLVVDGCEYACTYTGLEICDAKDNDCDGIVDADVEAGWSVDNCGACGTVCTTPNATPACPAGTCVVGACNPGFGDCNGQGADGCEVTLATDVAHCGTCGNACTFANAAPSCTAGMCGYTCLPDFWDLDGLASNGCEYACTKTSDTDLPDMAFVDANCDGIDGEVANAIFVSTSGNNANAGTRTAPKATIAAGLTEAVAQNKRDVYVALGNYTQQVTVTGGKNLFGGYDPAKWTRTTTLSTTILAASPALRIQSSNDSRVQLVTVTSLDASAPGASSIAAFIKQSTSVKLESVRLNAGDGAAGSNGSTGAKGADGRDGATGTKGCEFDDDYPGGIFAGINTCNQSTTVCSRPPGGAGGTSSCGSAGGRGGNAGYVDQDRDAVSGFAGSNGSPAGTGGAGGAGRGPYQGWTPAPSTNNGKPGQSGANGSVGTPAAGIGTVSASGYVAALATDGQDGVAGSGGGGGGGGGGDDDVCDSYGSGGGGGGSGGCGGAGGNAGQSGGASIGLLLFDATVAAEGLTITTNNGGKGGNGALGGGGGAAGAGGGSMYGDPDAQARGSLGGVGGAGGVGGQGGVGGPGGGGPTVGVMRGGTSTYTCNNCQPATLGTPGLGGTSPGNAAGTGAAGVSADVY